MKTALKISNGKVDFTTALSEIKKNIKQFDTTSETMSPTGKKIKKTREAFHEFFFQLITKNFF